MKQKNIAKRNISLYLIFLLAYYVIYIGLASDVIAQSEVYLSIRAGNSDFIGIGLGGFEAQRDSSGNLLWDSSHLFSVKNALENDLDNSGLFEVKSLADSMKTLPGGLFAQWKSTGAKYFLFGEGNNQGKTVIINVIDLKNSNNNSE